LVQTKHNGDHIATAKDMTCDKTANHSYSSRDNIRLQQFSYVVPYGPFYQLLARKANAEFHHSTNLYWPLSSAGILPQSYCASGLHYMSPLQRCRSNGRAPDFAMPDMIIFGRKCGLTWVTSKYRPTQDASGVTWSGLGRWFSPTRNEIEVFSHFYAFFIITDKPHIQVSKTYSYSAPLNALYTLVLKSEKNVFNKCLKPMMLWTGLHRLQVLQWHSNQHTTCPSTVSLLLTSASNFMLFFAHSSCNIIISFLLPRLYLSADLSVLRSASSSPVSSTHHTTNVSAIQPLHVLSGLTTVLF